MKEEKAKSAVITITAEGVETKVWTKGATLCIHSEREEDRTRSEAFCVADTKANVIARMILKTEETIATIKKNHPKVAEWCALYKLHELAEALGGGDDE